VVIDDDRIRPEQLFNTRDGHAGGAVDDRA